MIVAIDPGKKGGYVVFDVEGKRRSGRMPLRSDGDVDVSVFSDIVCEADEAPMVVIEKVHAAAGWSDKKDGSKGAKASPNTAFKMGDGLGQLKATFRAFRIEPLLVAPVTWKGHVLGNRWATKGDAIAYCSTWFPWVDLTPGMCRSPQDGIADAACIGQYAIYLLRNQQENSDG